MEFGSDFHSIKDFISVEGKLSLPKGNLYALGRHALFEIIKVIGPHTLWIPSYYCMESINILRALDLNIEFYPTFPEENPVNAIKKLPLKKDDALLLMNFFGLWGAESTPEVDCMVIEDHSHDLFSKWARQSKADYCFASLRKTYPLAEGGILWSPKNHPLPEIPKDCQSHADNAARRIQAMELKSEYLNHNNGNKSEFLKTYRETEECYDHLATAPLNNIDKGILNNFDAAEWLDRKKRNWNLLCEVLIANRESLIPFRIVSNSYFHVDGFDATPFSFVILLDSMETRDSIRKEMINQEIYPAILWNLPDSSNPQALQFSERMLSLHCDARYNLDNIKELSGKLLNILSKE